MELFTHALLLGFLAALWSDSASCFRSATNLNDNAEGTSLLDGDLRRLHASFYASYDSTQDRAWNSRHAFKHFVHQARLEAPILAEHFRASDSIELNAENAFAGHAVEVLDLKLNDDELEYYEERLVENLGEDATVRELQDMPDGEEKDLVWGQAVGRALESQKPLVTDHLVKSINKSSLGWVARLSEDLQRLSLKDGQALLGLLPNVNVGGESVSLFQESETENLEDLPREFDGRKRWAECREVLEHTRDQGQCGSCWAQSAAFVLETRLCIATGGRFTGPMAWLSSEYLASCSKSQNLLARINPWSERKNADGCLGGHSDDAFKHATRLGVPTGGPKTGWFSGHTCVPYSMVGNSLNHFDASANHETPPCPSECTNANYLRSFQEDIYKLSLQPRHVHKHEEAKREMLDGPVVFDHMVFPDFFAYGGGIYRPKSGQKLAGLHSTACFGFGPGYIECKNSWGKGWGVSGNFKVDPSSVMDWRTSYVTIGKIDLARSQVPEVHGYLTTWRQWLSG